MGVYIRTELQLQPEMEAIDWPLEVGWNERVVGASLTRGELVLRMTTRLHPWWEPYTKHRALDHVRWLARVLSGMYRQYEDVDETGRKRLPIWREAGGTLRWAESPGAEQLIAVLEPGCRPGSVSGGGLSLVYRLGQDRGRKMREAIKEGWMRVEGVRPRPTGAQEPETAPGPIPDCHTHQNRILTAAADRDARGLSSLLRKRLRDRHHFPNRSDGVGSAEVQQIAG